MPQNFLYVFEKKIDDLVFEMDFFFTKKTFYLFIFWMLVGEGGDSG